MSRLSVTFKTDKLDFFSLCGNSGWQNLYLIALVTTKSHTKCIGLVIFKLAVWHRWEVVKVEIPNLESKKQYNCLVRLKAFSFLELCSALTADHKINLLFLKFVEILTLCIFKRTLFVTIAHNNAVCSSDLYVLGINCFCWCSISVPIIPQLYWASQPLKS